MPLAFLAHQAVVLPLRIADPRRVSGTALVLGSMAPDAEYVLRTYPTGSIGHSWPGQVAFCLPLTLVLYAIATRLVAPAVAANLPAGRAPTDGGIRSVVLLAAHARPSRWTIVAASALVGSASHVLLDRAESAVVRAVASPLAGSTSAVVAQIAISLILATIAAVTLRAIARREVGASPEAPFWWPFWPLVGAIAAIGAIAGAAVRRPGFLLDEFATWVHIALTAVGAGFVGLVVASKAWLARARKSKSPVDSGSG